jgi:hypothetical protein
LVGWLNCQIVSPEVLEPPQEVVVEGEGSGGGQQGKAE